MFDLTGKTALVTGAATGLGAAIAIAFAENGASLIVTDRPGEDLRPTAEAVDQAGRRGGRETPGRVGRLAIDVTDLAQIRAGVGEALRDFGRIDILVNNAGINRPAAGLEVTPENWDLHFATNVRGGFFMAQAVAPGMIAAGWGRIIFISSQSGLVGIPGQPVYCATKGAVIQLVRTLGVEWARHGVTVNSIAPTFVETNLTRKRLQDPDFRRFVEGKIPCGKLGLPEQIAAAAVYLASNEAAMVNCHTHTVDGGWTAW
jgi:2-deoxy-D-gluconate 3-dehydrogenase